MFTLDLIDGLIQAFEAIAANSPFAGGVGRLYVRNGLPSRLVGHTPVPLS